LLHALLAHDEYISVRILASLGVPVEVMRAEAELLVDRSEAFALTTPELTPEAESVLDAAVADADLYGHAQVGLEDVLLALATAGDANVGDVFSRYGVEPDALRSRIAAFLYRGATPDAHGKSLVAPSLADPPDLARLLRELTETRTAKELKIAEGDVEAALRLRVTEEKLLREISQMRALG
jgi:ATP-dependent Clp protease ATP-binding subunit ClpA